MVGELLRMLWIFCVEEWEKGRLIPREAEVFIYFDRCSHPTSSIIFFSLLLIL